MTLEQEPALPLPCPCSLLSAFCFLSLSSLPWANPGSHLGSISIASVLVPSFKSHKNLRQAQRKQ